MILDNTPVVVTTRPVTTSECPWLLANIPQGTTLWVEWDAYGVCTTQGIAVSAGDGGRYFEVPLDAVAPLDGV